MSPEPFHVEALIFVIILLVYVLTSHIIENRKIPYLHESSIAIFMGILTAVTSKYVPLLLPRPSGNKLTSAMNCSSPSSSPPSSSVQDILSENPCSSKTFPWSAFWAFSEQSSDFSSSQPTYCSWISTFKYDFVWLRCWPWPKHWFSAVFCVPLILWLLIQWSESKSFQCWMQCCSERAFWMTQWLSFYLEPFRSCLWTK